MKKIKWTIMTLAILFSVCTAFSTRPKLRGPQEYYWTGTAYAMVPSDYGGLWTCRANTSVTCTYTFDGANYWAFRTGVYTPFDPGARAPQTEKTTK